MKTMKIKGLMILALCLWVMPLFAQLPVGSWRAHLSYYGVHSVAVTPEMVYAASDNGLLFYDKAEKEVGTWSKVDGLSETRISRIFYDQHSGYLVVAYDNSNLDFIRDGKLVNVPDIKNKSMSGTKSIHNMMVREGLLYLACSFGVVIIDLSTLLVQDTWYTQMGNANIEVNDIECFDGKFILASTTGVYATPQNNIALADFSTWEKEGEMGNSNVADMCVWQERLCVLKRAGNEHDTLYYYDGEHWTRSGIEQSPIRAIATRGNELLVGMWNGVVVYDTDESLIFYSPVQDVYSWQNVQDVAFDGDWLWVADDNNGLVEISREWYTVNLKEYDGPFQPSVFSMDYCDGVLAVAPGGVSATWANSWNKPDMAYFSENSWHNVLQKDNPELFEAYDLICVAVNPRNSQEIYGGTFWSGLAKYSGGTLETVYNRFNSPLVSQDTSEARIGGLCFDHYGNLWVSCCYSNVPLAVLKTDGTWATFPLSSFISGTSTLMGQVYVDSRNYKWVVMPRNPNTVVVLDDRGTISTPSDDRITRLNMNIAANIETTSVNCITEDKNGQMWIGCNLGIKVIYSPSQVFSGEAQPQNILIEQMNHWQNLFEFEEVTCIEVDDGNRKWVGTAKSGVFLISADGKKQLLHFTAEDSPLLSNRILDIKIQRKTGEVFFATDEGLVSYRGTATEGSEKYEHVMVFPNPVRETYHGLIAVTGLMENSFCKIADAAGNLVWQGYANGGELTWDGKDFYGQRPATGVYFVFSSDTTGKMKNVAKFLFIH